VVLSRQLAARFRRYELHGKVAVVTGGTRGLGLVLARELMDRGADVAICARDPREVDHARVDLVRRGTGKVFAMRADLTHKDELIRFLERTERVLGPIDVLINNAGVIQVGPMEVMTAEDFDAAMKIHFWAPLHAVLAVLPQMRRRHTGRIVNITSIGAKVAVPHLLPYSASKFAGYGLSTGLREELARDGVIVTTVCPGLMRTGSPRHAKVKGKQQQEYELFKIADSLPGLTMSAERAARQILDACVRGDAEVVLSLPAKLLASLYAFSPGFVQDLFGLVARVLPNGEGGSMLSLEGKDTELGPIPRFMTKLTDAASLRNNEV
jgi:short-subunit dehydrogenase